MSVPNCEHVLLIQEDGGTVVDGRSIQLGIVGLAQGDDLDLRREYCSAEE